MLNGLDLFSGIGGISLALRDWVQPVAYCEIERYAQAVLLQRMADNDIARAPIWDDVTSLTGSMLPNIDIVYGGFPCQDISVAGNGAGLEGKRSGLYFEIVRLCRELRPRFIFLENVPAITVRGLDRVLLELTALGYDSRWTIVSANELGAPHIRERWFLLAHANSFGIRNESIEQSKFQNKTELVNIGEDTDSESRRRSLWRAGGDKDKNRNGIGLHADGLCKAISDTNEQGLERNNGGEQTQQSITGRDWWATEPNVGRVVDGLSYRVDRIRGLGNAVVPQQAKEAFKRLIGIR